MKIKLHPSARRDLERIWRDTARRWGLDQADAYVAVLNAAFEFLAEFPRAAPERLEHQPPVRVHPARAHVIIYRIESDAIVVIRIRHAREDWMSDPAAGESGEDEPYSAG